ncbi:anaphase-promoting complex, cyclosome, subunit 4-domain-containing protein [Ampelomyces quisqualis]|uniref:Anaphase-promoting complex subunit 4 n=1 Tax=Ampelomyces quisqualis TaxID=50730 RepID=A0A6A5QGP7_AMPQU|nr:anaphase-promoting complex, cyclosome, subunit 4-domain-containing protein [Ampelomyces quisqualis]
MAASEPKKQRQLLQQAEKILLHPVHPHLIAYCPTMDLIALVTDEENLDVYRINGQRAFGLKRKSEDVNVDALQWEFNGKSIAISWSDGSTDLVNAETGKVSHKDLMLPAPVRSSESMDEDVPSRVKCIGWGLNFIDVDAVKRRTGLRTKKTSGDSDVFGQPTTEDWDAFQDGTTVEDFLQRQPDLHTLDIAPDLPDQLAMMDVETLLPKLPAIPLPPALPFMRISQADSGNFSSQVDVDSLLHSHHLRDQNSVDMFIRCSDQGTVHPSMYDSKETVNIHLPKSWGVKSTPLLHTSHPYSCSHSLLMHTTVPNARHTNIAFVPLTLNFIPSAGIYLHLIASKTSQLQNLLLYITQCLQRIRTFFKHSQDLPSKFMLNISETLSEKGLGDLVTNLFHLACTGNCSPTMHEWLVDELAEQGQKRWDTTVSTSLSTLIALVHENLMPALDRSSIIISRLRGLAQFHDTDWIFTSPLTDFTLLLETLKNMRLLAHTVLRYAGEEKRQFHAFIKWLRFVIDFEATEPESQSRGEMEGRDSGVDVALVLEYIQYGMSRSELVPYLMPESQLEGNMRDKEAASYEDTKKAVEVLRDGGGYKEEAVCLEHVLGHFKNGVTRLLRQVSKWQEGNVRMDGGVVLEQTPAKSDDIVADMRMVFEPSTVSASANLSTYIALPTPSKIHIHRITHAPALSSLPKDIASYAISTLSFPPHSTILDASFSDDTHLLVLLSPPPTPADQNKKANHVLVSIPYTPSPSPSGSESAINNAIISYAPVPSQSLAAALLPHGACAPDTLRTNICVTNDVVQKYTRHVFEGRFTPLKLVVNGRRGRRVVVVLGSDGKHYRVLDLDFRKGGGRADGEGETDDEEGVEGEDGDGDVEMGGA